MNVRCLLKKILQFFFFIFFYYTVEALLRLVEIEYKQFYLRLQPTFSFNALNQFEDRLSMFLIQSFRLKKCTQKHVVLDWS